jgi:hypothetical protein
MCQVPESVINIPILNIALSCTKKHQKGSHQHDTSHFPDPVVPVTIDQRPEKIPLVKRRHNPHVSQLSSTNATLWIRTPANFRKRVSDNNILSTGLQAYVKAVTVSILRELHPQNYDINPTSKKKLTNLKPNKLSDYILHYLPYRIYNRKTTKSKRIILQTRPVAQFINLVTSANP